MLILLRTAISDRLSLSDMSVTLFPWGHFPDSSIKAATQP
jgi:hypothetical protein